VISTSVKVEVVI